MIVDWLYLQENQLYRPEKRETVIHYMPCQQTLIITGFLFCTIFDSFSQICCLSSPSPLSQLSKIFFFWFPSNFFPLSFPVVIRFPTFCILMAYPKNMLFTWFLHFTNFWDLLLLFFFLLAMPDTTYTFQQNVANS